MKRTIRDIIVGVIIGVILIIIQNLWTGWPWDKLWIFNNHKIIGISDSDAFKIKELRTYNNRLLNIGDKFSYKSIMQVFHTDIPLSVSGITSYKDNVNIWCVCRDRYGGYYLQNPKVYINNQTGKWMHDNLYPRDEITLIIFVLVDQAGDELFQQKAINEDWGRFPTLPKNSREIAYIELRRYFQ